MLADLETGLVAAIKKSSLGLRLRQVDSLPDLEGDSLIGRFATDAPAIYVALGSFLVRNHYARPKFGVACVARNSRGDKAARHGDGVVIGLQEMLDAAMSVLDGLRISYGENDTVSFDVVSVDMVSSEALFQKGIYVGVVQIQTSADVTLPSILEESLLADFKTFHADIDVDPHQVSTEYNKWLQEPPDNSTSAPELSDTLILKE